MVRRALALALRCAARAAPGGRVRARDAAVDRARSAARKLDAAPARGRVHASTRRSRRASARCGCSTPSGQEVQTGKAFHPGGKGAEIAIKLKPGLGDGTYTATYRVVSADGHPVSSGFVFTVGEAAAPAESLDELLAGGGSSGSITNTALVGRARLPVRRDRARPRRADLLRSSAGARWRRSRAFTRAARAHAAGRRDRRAASRRVAAIVLQGAVGEGGSFWAAARPGHGRARCSAPASAAPGASARSPGSLVLIVAARRGPLRGRRAPPPPPAGARAGRRVVAGGGAARRGPRRPPLAAPAAPRALDAAARRARRPAVRARAAALARRPHERAAAGRGPAAREHPARARDERVARRDRRARVRAARRHAELEPDARTPLLAGVVGRFSALAERSRCPSAAVAASCRRSSRSAASPRCSTRAFGRAVLIKIVVALGDRRARLRQPPAARCRRCAAARPTARAAPACCCGARCAPSSRSAWSALAATGALSSYAPSVAESAGPYATTVNVGPARRRGHRRPGQGRPQPAPPLPVRPPRPARRSRDRGADASPPRCPPSRSPRSRSRRTSPAPATTSSTAPASASRATGRSHTVIRVSDFDEYETRFTGADR